MTKILWTQRSNFGPSPRGLSAMAFDSTRSRVVLFGGNPISNFPFNDTWEWDGSFWTQMEDVGPIARLSSAMAYDSAGKVSVLFGGKAEQPIGDTWQWDGTDWTQLSETGPGARWGHAMAFDSTRNRTVLFAGQSADNNRFNDTWEFDGTNWTQQQDAGPSPRAFHSMAYDSTAGRVIMFGGITPDIKGTMLGDTWAWDGKEWVQVAEFGPSARHLATMASNGGSVILYGGLISLVGAQAPEADTWEFDGKLWTQRQDIGPGPLEGASMAYDSGRGQAVLFGGLATSRHDAALKLPTPYSGFTWECPVAAVTPTVLRVTSLLVPGGRVGVRAPTVLIIDLNGQAPLSGAVVDLGDTVFNPNGSHLTRVTIPSGLSTVTVPVSFVNPGVVQISGSIAGTPAVTISILVQ